MAAFEMIVNLRARDPRKTMTRLLLLSPPLLLLLPCGSRDCISVFPRYDYSRGLQKFGNCLRRVAPHGGIVFGLMYVTKGGVRLCHESHEGRV